MVYLLPHRELLNGAVWAPASFQYIKGLEYYGYRELAFAEALRHVEALSDVYQAGKTDSVIGSATFWENYSSEYTRQGDPARDNFVGWTGALGIGVIIEDLLGIGLRAPDNAVDWDLRLTEENGISNLYSATTANRFASPSPWQNVWARSLRRHHRHR